MKFLIAGTILNLVWLTMAFIAFVAYWGWTIFGLTLLASLMSYGLLFTEFWAPRTTDEERAP